MQSIIHFAEDNVDFLGRYSFKIYLVILVILVAMATFSDIRTRRIPNWLVAAGTVIAVVYHALSPFGEGAIFTLAGLAVGMAILIPLYVLRTMGAGDVKLMGMVGAFVGTAAVINVVLATMVAGGLLALAVTACKRMLPQLIANLRDMMIQRHIRGMGFGTAITAPNSVGKMPYALAIATGTFFQIFILQS